MKGTRVLLVEDNPDLADNLGEILTGAGCAVRIAARCADARAAAADGFDVALVDVHLPDGDGIDLAPALKAMARDSEVILLTGFATLESAISAVRAGAWAYLVKPCSPADLLLVLGQAARQVQLQKGRHALEQRARLAEKLASLGTMAAGLAHEIRNPLNAARLQLEVAQRRLRSASGPDVERALDGLVLVRAEMDRLNGIVEDALAFARPATVSPVPGDLAVTVATVTRFLEPDVAAAGVTLYASGTEAPLPLSFDAPRVKEVLINLIRNATEAAGSGGRVWVSLSRQGNVVELRVEDSGPGIPEGVDPFVPFVTTKERGTGLGLPTAHRIVSEHGGSLFIARDQARTAVVAQFPADGPELKVKTGFI